MAGNRIQSQTVSDFRGGLNLRSDAFQLAENEFQLCLNVELDGRGGFRSRKGWERWSDTAIAEPAWDPRAMYSMTFNGVEQVFLANKATYPLGSAGGGAVLMSTDGVWAPIDSSIGELVHCKASPHMADFAQWGNLLYIATGSSRSAKYDGTNATLLNQLSAGTFEDDYTSPGSGGDMPAAEVIATHQGRIFLGGVREDTVYYPHRLRWSHPNNPEAWASFDFQDFGAGGSRITAIVPFADHLVVFKTDSVWRFDGYDTDSFQIAPVSMRLGAQTRQAVAVAEDRIYFFSYPHGVFEYRNDGIFEVSEPLRPGLRSPGFNGTPGGLDNVWLAYVGQRLWCNVPFSQTHIPTDAYTSLVLDPSLSERGGWTAFRGADDGTVGPMVEAQTSDKVYAASRSTAAVVRLEQIDEALDDFDGTPTPFQSYLITRWFDGGEATRKKRWKKPDLVVKDSLSEQIFHIDVYHDFDEARPARRFDVIVEQRADGFVWGDFVWGDGSLWGGPPEGSRIEDASVLGLAMSVRLRVDGPPGVAWGVDAIVFKYIWKRRK